jgi:hypothetical protein
MSSILRAVNEVRSKAKYHLLIPFPIFEFVEDSRKIEILFEMFNCLLTFGIRSRSRLVGMDVVSPH